MRDDPDRVAAPGGGHTRKDVPYLTAPRDVYVVLTSRCNLRCLHCYGSYGDARAARELTTDEWRGVFRQLKQQGVFFLNLAGGEPTLHPGFPSLIDELVALDLPFVLTTNGIASRRCTAAIARARDHLLGLKVSLDGPTVESHGALRAGPRSASRAFESTLTTILQLRDSDVPFTIASCLHRGNVHLLRELAALVVGLRPTSWFISTIAPAGRAAEHYDRIFASDGELGAEVWQEIREQCEAADIYVRFIDMSFGEGLESRLSAFTCPAATSFCEIHSDGIMAPCPMARIAIPSDVLRFENVVDRPVREIWEGPSFRQFRMWRTAGCEGCATFDRCGRCVAQSFQWFRDPLSPAPYCVEKGDLLGLRGLAGLQARLEVRRTELRHA